MKIQNITSPLITSDDLPCSIMGMDRSGMDMAIYYMRDKIYSNKIGAVVREYACNAIDEHKKHDIARPVEIGIRINPVDNASVFYVRDFAKGLSETGIRTIFGMYFKSTKSDSNDQIGGFGVGSKSANCYTDTFYVVSHHRGTKTVYTCTLGGGKTSVPVGHIYKISEEPTEETGIEITVDILNYQDAHTFEREIKNFIIFCASPIEANIKGTITTPLVPVYTQTVGDYVFKSYPVSGTPLVYYRMGAVTYKSDIYSNINGSSHTINDGHVLVVEIPLGRMSLPISRESFESTPHNNKILADVNAAIVQLCKDDLDQFNNLPVGQILADISDQKFKGNIFSCNKSKLYGQVYTIIHGLNKTMFGENIPAVTTHLNKPVVAIIPNNRSSEYWKNLLFKLSSKENKNYYYILDTHIKDLDNVPQEIKDFFFFKKVKSTFFKFEKELRIMKHASTFSVYEKFSSWKPKTHHFTPLDLHNYSRKVLNLDEAESIEEAQGQMDEFVIDNRDKLKYVSITKSSYRYDNSFWCNSTKLVDAMVDIGWKDADSAEFKQILTDISTAEQTARQNAILIENAVPCWIETNYHNKLKTNIAINIKRAKSFTTMINNVLAEDSIRGKILKGFQVRSNYQYQNNSEKLSREELRKILTLR